MLQFVSKAQNLKLLQGKLKTAKILPMVILTLEDFQRNKKEILGQILRLDSPKIIVRSSSKKEDSKENSNAGAFLSLANVSKDEKKL